MFLFKKKIDFVQFIADAIFGSMNSYDSNSEKMILMADEFKVLDKHDIEVLKELGYALIISDLMVGIINHFNEKISNEDAEKVVTALYVKFLKEVKSLDESQIREKISKLQELLWTKTDNTQKDLRLRLCFAFSNLYSGDDYKDQKHKGKNFAAFKLAKAIVKADLIKIMLKDYNIIWK